MAFETTPNIEQSWRTINYPVGIPGKGILAARTWDQLTLEIKLRYQTHGMGLSGNKSPHGDDWERARVAKFNDLWPQYPDFEYQVNSLGFRDTHEVLDQVDHCYYGCSMTWGEGVPHDATWSQQLDQVLGTVSNNFGIGGTSAEECMLMFMATSWLVQMKRAVFMFPDYHRKTVCIGRENNQTDCIYWQLLANDNWKKYTAVDAYSRNIRDAHDAHFRTSGVEHMDSFRKVVQTILYVAELRGIEVVLGSWNDQTCQVLRQMKDDDDSLKIAQWCPMTDVGRDDHHPGLVTQANWAREYIKVI